MSITKNVMPSRLGTSTEVRAMRIPHLANCAPEVHTFGPLTIDSSPSRSALVCRPARSDPAPIRPSSSTKVAASFAVTDPVP